MATPQQKKPEVPPEVQSEGGDSKKLAHVVSYYVGKDTYIQASVWAREVLDGDNSFTVYDVSVRKLLKQNDEWKSVYRFRGSELPFVIRALDRAEVWILESHKQDAPF